MAILSAAKKCGSDRSMPALQALMVQILQLGHRSPIHKNSCLEVPPRGLAFMSHRKKAFDQLQKASRRWQRCNRTCTRPDDRSRKAAPSRMAISQGKGPR